MVPICNRPKSSESTEWFLGFFSGENTKSFRAVQTQDL